MVLYACTCVHCILALSRIVRFDPSRQTHHSEVVLSHGRSERLGPRLDHQRRHWGETLMSPRRRTDGPLIGRVKPHAGDGPRAYVPMIQHK
jgi:hypothetical protein